MPSLLATSSFQSPISGTDSLSTLYQILSLVSLHYLTLSIFTPPFLVALSTAPPSALTFDSPLNFEGGAAQVGMILDWREVSSRTTFDWSPLGEDFLSWRKGLTKEQLMQGLDQGDRNVAKDWRMGSVWLGDVETNNQDDHLPSFLPATASASLSATTNPVLLDASRVVRQGSRAPRLAGPGGNGESEEIDSELASTGGSKAESDLQHWEWKATRDPWRGWAIAFAWGLACAIDVFLLTTIIRRPKHILDHVFTLHLLNLLLTSWYTSSIPTSLFWWGVMILHGLTCVFWSERLAIGREMNVQVGQGLVGSGRDSTRTENGVDADAGVEVGSEIEGQGRQTQVNNGPPHVLYDGTEDEEEEEEEEEGEETTQMLKKPTMTTSGGGGSDSDNGFPAARPPRIPATAVDGGGELIEMQSFRPPPPPLPSSSSSSS